MSSRSVIAERFPEFTSFCRERVTYDAMLAALPYAFIGRIAMKIFPLPLMAASLVAFGAFLTSTCVSAASPGDMPSFDHAQIAHGKSLYASACAKCHGASLQGVSAPALTGPAFAPASHSHLTIGGIFGYMSTNMPADRPGKLKPQDYADIMAFLLYSNGYRPKAEKLTADVARASVTPLNAGPGQ